MNNRNLKVKSSGQATENPDKELTNLFKIKEEFQKRQKKLIANCNATRQNKDVGLYKRKQAFKELVHILRKDRNLWVDDKKEIVWH